MATDLRHITGYSVTGGTTTVDLRQVVGYTVVETREILDLDLFSMQGVLVEQDTPAIELFSMQGVVIEKSEPAAEIVRLSGLVTQDTQPNTNIHRVSMLVAQTSSGFVNLPLDISGLDRFKQLVQQRSSIALDWASLSVSAPRHPAGQPAERTEVDVITLEASTYRSHVTVTYLRRRISELSPLKLLPADYSTVDEVVQAIRALGYLIDNADIDYAASSVSPDNITLVAGPSSFFFVPGGRLVFGEVVSMSSVFGTTDLTGFEAADWLDMSDVFSVTNLSGYEAVDS